LGSDLEIEDARSDDLALHRKGFVDVKTGRRLGQTVANRKRGAFEYYASSAPTFPFTYWN